MVWLGRCVSLLSSLHVCEHPTCDAGAHRTWGLRTTEAGPSQRAKVPTGPQRVRRRQMGTPGASMRTLFNLLNSPNTL